MMGEAPSKYISTSRRVFFKIAGVLGDKPEKAAGRKRRVGEADFVEFLGGADVSWPNNV